MYFLILFSPSFKVNPINRDLQKCSAFLRIQAFPPLQQSPRVLARARNYACTWFQKVVVCSAKCTLQSPPSSGRAMDGNERVCLCKFQRQSSTTYRRLNFHPYASWTLEWIRVLCGDGATTLTPREVCVWPLWYCSRPRSRSLIGRWRSVGH